MTGSFLFFVLLLLSRLPFGLFFGRHVLFIFVCGGTVNPLKALGTGNRKDAPKAIPFDAKGIESDEQFFQFLGTEMAIVVAIRSEHDLEQALEFLGRLEALILKEQENGRDAHDENQRRNRGAEHIITRVASRIITFMVR